MTLAEFAHLVDEEPKWVINTLTALQLPRAYSFEVARQVSVMRAIVQAVAIPLARAYSLAGTAVLAGKAGRGRVTIRGNAADDVGLTLDLERILSAFHVRLSTLRSVFAVRVRGRLPGGKDPLAAASDWGLDLTLIADNLRKTPEARIRQLDAMAAFAREVRRGSLRAR